MAESLNRKQNFIDNVIRKITLMADSIDDLTKYIDIFLKREYNSGGADPITDDDCAFKDITAAELAQSKNLVDGINAKLDENSEALRKIMENLRKVN